MVASRIDPSEDDAGASTAGNAAWRVVHNRLGQHSVWPGWKPLPDGWACIGVQGSKHDCLTHIESVWTDIASPSR
jgi:MbtH protein